jgi:hypothetical protein
VAKKGRNPMIGRHAVGGQLARPGSIRGGQSVSARPITASRSDMRPRPPVLANQAETSRDLQSRISGQSPQPFTDRGGAATLPAPANRNYSQKAGLPAKGIFGSSHGGSEVTHIGCGNTETTADMVAAVGGGMPSGKGYNPANNFRGTSGKRQAGRPGNSSQHTSAKEDRRLRQTGY